MHHHLSNRTATDGNIRRQYMALADVSSLLVKPIYCAQWAHVLDVELRKCAQLEEDASRLKQISGVEAEKESLETTPPRQQMLSHFL